jgi:two-component system LytT family response regulator
MELTALIVDDEPPARRGLRMLLAEDPDIAVIREAQNGREAITAIRDLQPGIVFLDVQMPEIDGFAVVEAVGPELLPAVIFVTAHDSYAIRAFEINAVDYLLKPVTAARFRQAVARAKADLNARQPEYSARRVLSLLETIGSPQKRVKRLAVRSTGKTLFVNVEDIDWIRAAENYVELHRSSEMHLLHTRMNTFEEWLDPDIFLRVHRSTIVNLRRIKEIQSGARGEFVIVLDTGVRLQSGRSYYDKIKALTANPF